MFGKLFYDVIANNYFLIFVLTLLFLGLVILLIRLVNKVLNNIKISHEDIKKEIQNSVMTKLIQFSPEVDLLIQLSIDNWRLAKKIKEVERKLSNKEKQTLNFSMERIEKQLGKFDIEIKDYTNERYYEGLNLDVISIEKNKSIKEAIIKDTTEPAVIVKGQLVKKAKVIILTN
jgi:hypothetical protein